MGGLAVRRWGARENRRPVAKDRTTTSKSWKLISSTYARTVERRPQVRAPPSAPRQRWEPRKNGTEARTCRPRWGGTRHLRLPTPVLALMVPPLPPQRSPLQYLLVVVVAVAFPYTRAPSAKPCAGKRSRGRPLGGRTDRCRRRHHTLLPRRPSPLLPGLPSSPSAAVTSRHPHLPPCPQNSHRPALRRFAPFRRPRVFPREVEEDRHRRYHRRRRRCCRRPRT